MAKIVIGIETSHRPALNSSAEDYRQHAKRDFSRPHHLTKDGQICSYLELLATADPALVEEITPEKIKERVTKCNKNIEHLSSTIAAAELDALIIVGDDQKEQYHDENMPSVLVYTGDTIQNALSSLPDNAPTYWKKARAQSHEDSSAKDYPVATELGRAITKAVEESPEDMRIGILASGGLSHVTIDEELDRDILKAMARKDLEELGALPINKLNSGSSEIRNWLVVAGAVEELDLGWHDYQPCYRTAAGNGCGMAFAIWR